MTLLCHCMASPMLCPSLSMGALWHTQAAPSLCEECLILLHAMLCDGLVPDSAWGIPIMSVLDKHESKLNIGGGRAA